LLCNLISAVVITFLAADPRALAQESKDKKDILALRLGAENGNAEDQDELGFRYANGDGVPKNVSEAVKWWRKAAEQGQVDSQYMLGATYIDGDEGIPKDYAEALNWNKKAAAKGHAGSLAMLGDTYSEGYGVPKDNVKGYAWYSLAVAAGDESAGKFLNLLEEEMTQAQITEGQRQAKEWQAVINTQKKGGDARTADVSGAKKKADEAIQNTGVDVPILNARTASSGRKTVKSGGGELEEEQVTRSLSVAVELRTSRVPSQPYEVQCFFIGRSETTKENFLYNVQRRASSAATDALTFQAPSIEGTNTKRYNITVSGDFTGRTTDGDFVRGTYTGTATSTDKTKGDKFYGWIVRVVSQGQIVRIASNQTSLKTLAENNPTGFDKAAASAK
jgi:hypothetical protein